MKVKVYSRGETEFDLDAEYQAPYIRSAITVGEGVADEIINYTDTERSDISHDEHATVMDPDGTVLWSGWLSGDPEAAAPGAENRMLRDTLKELLGEFGLSGSHFTASLSREHYHRLCDRLADL